MIELPEARVMAGDLEKTILGKTIIEVITGSSPHKFTFFEGNPSDYKKMLLNKKVTKIKKRNFYVEFEVEDITITMRDGINIRYYKNAEELPIKHQLLLKFDDNSYLVVTVAMYALIAVFKTGEYINKYYQAELDGLSPMDEKFNLPYFKSLITDDTTKLSAKAFLATEQRILGIGNGVVQDILFNAKINPREKIKNLSDQEIENLYNSLKTTLEVMINKNGRNTEKDIYGNPGNYQNILSKNTVNTPCPFCQNNIKKEQFLGGSIYYCPTCQVIK